jgi:hypothetical protein
MNPRIRRGVRIAVNASSPASGVKQLVNFATASAPLIRTTPRAAAPGAEAIAAIVSFTS